MSSPSTSSKEVKTEENNVSYEHDLEERTVETQEENILQKAWNKKLIWTAYVIVIATAFIEAFANDSTSSLDSYATSNFNAHSLIATVAVVYKITAICSYPILAKIADLLGRGEGFTIAVILYTLAYVLYASCTNVETYVAGEIFFSIGKTGYRIFQQIFIADTTSLINRGLLSQLPNAIGAIPSLYAGTYVMDSFLEHSTWRWGYGCFAIVLGVSLIPLAVVMFYLDHRAKKNGERKVIRITESIDPNSPWYKKAFQILFVELDLFGGILLLCGMALFFVPFTLTGKQSSYRWHEGRLIAMLVVGFLIFAFFLVWNLKIAKKPFVPVNTLKLKSALIIIILVALDLCENSSFATYFITTLQVSGYYTAGGATRVDRSKKVCIDIFNVVCGLLMKYTKRSKIYALIGIPVLILGHGLLVWAIWRDGKVERQELLILFEVFIGAGRGLYQASLQVIIQGIAGVEGIAMSTAFFLAFNSVGSLIGSAIAGGIWNSVILKKLNKYLPEEHKHNATKIYKNLVLAKSYKKGTPARDAIARSYAETLRIIGWVGLGIIIPMFFLMWFIKEVPLTKYLDAYGNDSSDDSIEKSSEKIPEKKENTNTDKQVTA